VDFVIVAAASPHALPFAIRQGRLPKNKKQQPANQNPPDHANHPLP
jgi:hypothetical protein